MASEVMPGLWWLHGTRGCNVYLLRAADGSLALVDTGFGANVPAILRELEAVTGARRLDFILLTHRHVDHSGAAAGLHQQTGARIVAGEADCHRRPGGDLVLRRDWRPPNWVRRALGAVLGNPAAHGPVPVHIAIPASAEACEVAPGIEAVPAPGHTRGTLCYVAREQRACFVGDLCISHRDRLSRSMRAANDDERGYLRSLQAFVPHAAPHGFPGHGYPVLECFPAALEELARRPRRPSALRNLPSRARKLWRFGQFILCPRTGDGP